MYSPARLAAMLVDRLVTSLPDILLASLRVPGGGRPLNSSTLRLVYNINIYLPGRFNHIIPNAPYFDVIFMITLG